MKMKTSSVILLNEEKELLKKKNRIEKILLTKEYLRKDPDTRNADECNFIASMLRV
jgi:hypothetical protein